MFICEQNMRLDLFLAKKMGESRNQIHKLIKNSHVKVNEKTQTKPSYLLNIDDVVVASIPKQTITSSSYKIDFDIDVLYEDEYIMVLNKPPFLTVHPAPSVKEATLVDWLKEKNIRLSNINGEERHGIVHRLDKLTSGAIIIAKTNEAHINLSIQLENKSMGRYYLAMIDLPLKEKCIVDKPIARNPKNRLKMAVVEGGRQSKSAFYPLLSSPKSPFSLIIAKLYSGRTHQIRVHLNSLSRHILGDNLYGFKSQKAKIPRVMLHAYILYLKHPISNEPLMVNAPFFDDFNIACEKYFLRNKNDKIFDQSSIVSSFDDAHHWLCQ